MLSLKFPSRLRRANALSPLLLVATLLTGGSVALAASRAPNIRNIRVTHDAFKAHSEPYLAENPRNPKNLLAGSKFFSNPNTYEFKIGTFYSTNAGRSWRDSGLLPGFRAFQRTSDVSITYDRRGAAFVCVLASGPGRSGIFVSRSNNGGKTFGEPVPVYLDTEGRTFNDKPWIAIDGTKGPNSGNIYVAWNLDTVSGAGDPDHHPGNFRKQLQTSPPPYGLVVSRSTDGGKTFSAPLVLTGFTATTFPIGAIPAIAPDGSVYITYAVLGDSGVVTELDQVESHDGGKTFTAPKAIQIVAGLPGHLGATTFRNISMPAFIISPTNGAMVVAWADMRYGDADILATQSANGGRSWTLPVRVNNDRVHDGKDQFQPQLAVAPDGVFTCAWFDRRFDRHNRNVDEEIAQSRDSGRTWGTNLRVTTHSWNPDIDAPRPEGSPSNTFIGDYQGLAADNSSIHPLWNDTQNHRTQEIRTATFSYRLFAR